MVLKTASATLLAAASSVLLWTAQSARSAAVSDSPSSNGTGSCFLRAEIDLGRCRRFHGIDTWIFLNGTWTRHASFNCFAGHGAVDLSGNLGNNYTLVECESTCLKTPNCTAVCTSPPALPPPKPELPFVDVFGSTSQICTGAQMVATKKSLLVWGECQIKPEPKNPSDPKNLVIQLRRSTDFGGALPNCFSWFLRAMSCSSRPNVLALVPPALLISQSRLLLQLLGAQLPHNRSHHRTYHR